MDSSWIRGIVNCCKDIFPLFPGVNAYNAAVNGDVLAGSNEIGKVVKPKQDKPSEQPSFSAWRS